MLIRKNAQNLCISGAILCVVLNFAQCRSAEDSNVTPAPNSTFASSVLDSVVSCWSKKSTDEDGGSCLKSKLYKICEQFLRHRLIDSFSDEERAELMQYQPMVRKMVRILEKDSQGSWLDTKISNHLKSLFEESTDDSEGRKKKNKGMGQMIVMSLVSGLAVMIPLVFKVIFLMAAKALVAGKVAIILSALSHFNKNSHHDHDAVHETSLRRQAIMQ